jgi:xanthine dehydrogenase accessory factor
MPELTVLGASPVAEALAQIAPQFHWSISRGVNTDKTAGKMNAIVVATQGQGDLDALRDALAQDAHYVAFVGSQKKFATLSRKLGDAGVSRAELATVSAPAGLDIGAVTPEEIALSILAELITVRRTSIERSQNA